MSTTIVFTVGELAALNSFADHWLHHRNPDDMHGQTASEWRAIHKIRHPDYAPQDLIDEERP